jgi:serine/threonine protein kinase/Flp pilus assembly protein TadD
MATQPGDGNQRQAEAGSRPESGGRASFDPDRSLATQQVDEMVAAWRRGERPLVEDVLARHPELSHEAAVRLIYEEVCLRLEAGLTVDPAEITARFPQWRSELALLLDCQLEMHAVSGEPVFPEVGESLAGFHLLWELGRGAAGRVYLASQPALADRPVVLKVTRRGREEHLSLARLQHMNIVPLFSEHVLQARNLQVLCMPFLGAAALDQILQTLKVGAPQDRTGKQVIEALDRIEQGLPIALPSQGPFRSYLARASYVAAICSIGACLADGLQYAHDRGLVHMDIKPSNVLLADDGQPMLLDFHLARGPIRPQDPAPPWLGGTPHYMAPEQARAVDCLRQGKPIAAAVDHRADIYSLGVLLHEALGGSLRGSYPEVGPPLSRSNPRVSVGLSDIIQKCCQPDPAERYATAEELATDLRCHLADLPLRGVPNRSPAELWSKWRRRRPFALSRSLIVLAAAGAVIAAVGVTLFAYRERIAAIRLALQDGRASLQRGHQAEAASMFRQGLALTSRMPGVSQLRQEISASLAAALRSERAAVLHRVAENIRFRYAMALPSPEEGLWLITRGQEIWQTRGQLTPPESERISPELDLDIRRDMLDFVAVWTDLQVRLATPQAVADARREALRIIAEAQTQFGSSPSLERARRSHAQALGQELPETASAVTASAASEYCDLGTFFLRAGNLEQAAQQFQLGLELRPQDFWLNFYAGLCAYRAHKFEDAVHAFHICIVLSPETAECYYNRGLASQELGDLKRALADYDQALRRNPALTDAALNRAILLYRQRRYDEAMSDLKRALDSGPRASTLGEVHYLWGLVELAREHEPLALEHLETAAAGGHAKARVLLERLRREGRIRETRPSAPGRDGPASRKSGRRPECRAQVL